jgi:superfamily I DNA and/or RNA helicase
MIRDEELLACFVCYGRAPVQDFVTKSHDVQDTIQYLQMERDLEVFTLTSFVTKDLKSFEKRKNSLWSDGHEMPIVKNDRQHNERRPSEMK